MSLQGLPDPATLGRTAARLLDELARFGEPGRGVTRLYLSPEHAAALDWVEGVMNRAGLAVRRDATATLFGRREGDGRESRTLLLGSHIDSVREGGAFDGALGVVVPIVCTTALADAGRTLPFPVEVVAFGDEEGVRFPSTLGGSRALAGRFPMERLAEQDGDGTSLADAVQRFGRDPAAIPAAARDPAGLLGYVELHIEQGPVLEAEGLPMGVVSAIAAAERHHIRVVGEAGHAGTVPMGRRRDALAGAAEMIAAVERHALAHAPAVGTVGRLEALPGAVNVVPGEVAFTLDLRAPGEPLRDALAGAMLAELETIAVRRGLGLDMRLTHHEAGATMDPALRARLGDAVRACGHRHLELPSGAGHDAMVMAGITQRRCSSCAAAAASATILMSM